jgi:hypothetical protein
VKHVQLAVSATILPPTATSLLWLYLVLHDQADSLASKVFAQHNQRVNSTLLRACVRLRHKVYKRLVRQDIKSQVATAAIYK